MIKPEYYFDEREPIWKNGKFIDADSCSYDKNEMDAFLEEQAVKQREWTRFVHNELKELRIAWEDGNETLFLTILENLKEKVEKEARK